MNIIRSFRYTAALFGVAAVAAMATGCSDDDKWTPGPEPEPDCAGAYFGALSSYNLILEPDDSRMVAVTVGRGKTDEALTLPIVTEICPDGVVVPESVEFAAGEQVKTFYVDLENMPPKSSGTVALSIPAELTSPYAAGTSSLSFNVTVSGAWIPVAEGVYLDTDGVYQDMYTTLYYLDGTGNFKLPDFFGSGLDLIFVQETPGNGFTYIKPVKNFRDATDAWIDLGFGEYTYGGGWFLYDDANSEYPWWCPDGVTYPEVDYLEFENSSSYMMLITDDENNGYVYFNPYTYLTDGTGRYIILYYKFKTTYSPFTDAAAQSK